MSLSVVVPLSEARCSPRGTLESLSQQEHPLQEVVLVCESANSCFAQVSGFVQEFQPRFKGSLRLLEVSSSSNPVALWNAGVDSCMSDWVSVLTPQVTVRPGFARALLESAERSDSASVLRAGWTRERPGGAPAEQHTLLSVRTVTHPAEALYEQRFGPKASSAAAALRRSAWKTMGGFAPEINLLGDWLGDWALWLIAGAIGDTVRSPETIADIHADAANISKAEELRQMFVIYRDLLPRAARTAKVENLSWIDAASRKRFRDVAIAASNELGPAQATERQEIANALESWAEAVDQSALLKRLRNGERIRSFALGTKMKPALRRVVAAMR